jgi:hypothetical protein
MNLRDPRLLTGGLVAATWLVGQVLPARRGIRRGGDTGRYLDAAASLLRGEWPRDKAWA